jgi:hypothetical protein
MNCAVTEWIARGILLIGVALLASCRSSESSAGGTGSAEALPVRQATAASPPAGPHWVQDTRLRTLMDGIAIKSATVPEGTEDVESPASLQQKQSFDLAAALADTLAQTALQIPQVPGKDKLSEADRRGFDAEANTLHELALELKKGAQAHKIERMQSTLSTISSTCTACHTRYRDLTGFLQPRAALNIR